MSDWKVEARNKVLESLTGELHRRDYMICTKSHSDGTAVKGSAEVADSANRDCDAAKKDGTITWRHILNAQVCDSFAAGGRNELRVELIKVAAVAVRWAEDLDGRWPDP